jgi:hypothetical protein
MQDGLIAEQRGRQDRGGWGSKWRHNPPAIGVARIVSQGAALSRFSFL